MDNRVRPQKGQWVIAKHGTEWFPGLVDECDDDEIRVDCMQRTRNRRRGVSTFYWPAVNDCYWYDIHDIITHIRSPIKSGNNSRVFLLHEDDEEKIKLLASVC